MYEYRERRGVVWTKKKKKILEGKAVHANEHSERGVGVGGRINGKTLPCIDGCVIDGPTTFDKSIHYV